MTNIKLRNEMEQSIRRYSIIGVRKLSNYFWAISLLLGGLGLGLTGFSTYLKTRLDLVDYQIASWIQASSFLMKLDFFPQGLVLVFYGSLSIIFSFYLSLLIGLNIGSGFNELNQKEKQVRIFRLGFPGLNRRIDASFNFQEIESIKIVFKEQLTIFKCRVYLSLKDKRDIPILGIDEPLTLEQIESQAAEMAKFLKVELISQKN